MRRSTPLPWHPLRVIDPMTDSIIYCLIERSRPRDGDMVVIEDATGARWRQRYRASEPLPIDCRIIARSRAVVIPE